MRVNPLSNKRLLLCIYYGINELITLGYIKSIKEFLVNKNKRNSKEVVE